MTMQTSVVDRYEDALRYFIGEGTLHKTLKCLSRDLDQRSTSDGVSIEVMTTGEYPGDGRPKPVSIPNPVAASTEINGVKYVTLEKLIELKLASGISAADRLKDLADVQELIKIRKLDADFAAKLDPYVRTKYLELEEAVRKSESSQEK